MLYDGPLAEFRPVNKRKPSRINKNQPNLLYRLRCHASHVRMKKYRTRNVAATAPEIHNNISIV